MAVGRVNIKCNKWVQKDANFIQEESGRIYGKKGELQYDQVVLKDHHYLLHLLLVKITIISRYNIIYRLW
jgi:hypothetical protein